MHRSMTACALILGSVAGAAAGAQPEVEIEAHLDREEVGLDEPFVLAITVVLPSRGPAPEFMLPPLRDFEVVSRSTSEDLTFAMGGGSTRLRRSRQTSLTLVAHRPGHFLIEPVRLVYRGQSYASSALPLRVHPAAPGAARPAAPPPPEGLSTLRLGNKDLVLRAMVDVDRPVVGQQVSWSLWLLARVNLSGIDKLQLPRMDGFWAEDVETPQQLVAENRIIDGAQVQAFLLRRRALFPLREGKLTIEPAEAEISSGMGLLFSRGTLRRRAQPLLLDVQPLPPGRPAAFDLGNVGQWSLSATLDPPAVPLGQPVTLRLVVSGRGNLRDVQPPRLPAIPGLRAYDPTTTDRPSIEKGRVGGVRTVEQLLVPERTGSLELPPLAMETFDPEEGAYRTLKTPPLRITVGEGRIAGGDGTALPSPPGHNLLPAGGLRPIRLRLTRASGDEPPWNARWYWALFGGAPAAFAALAGGMRAARFFARDPEQRRRSGARIAARKRLRGAEALLRKGAPGAELHAEVARSLMGYLADRQGIAAPGLTREQLGTALRALGHSNQLIDKLRLVLDECDRARFSPGKRDPRAQEALLDRADEVLAALDRRRPA